MPERIFGFVQADLPFHLGPPDGRWMLRKQEGAGVWRIVVVGEVKAPVREPRRRRPSTRPAQVEPSPVQVVRATVIDPNPLGAEAEAARWLGGIDTEQEATVAFDALNRLLHAHRIAAADPYTREIHPSQARTLRVGFGEGAQVAEGRWLEAKELPAAQMETARARPRGGARGRTPRRRQAARLSAQQQGRLAALLGARAEGLLCEELALRARLDLNHGRPAHAALELAHAYAAISAELSGRSGPLMERRLKELQALRGEVQAMSEAVLGKTPVGESPVEAPPGRIDEDLLRRALERLEATLRARAAMQ